jgi:hypothetical protein
VKGLERGKNRSGSMAEPNARKYFGYTEDWQSKSGTGLRESEMNA